MALSQDAFKAINWENLMDKGDAMEQGRVALEIAKSAPEELKGAQAENIKKCFMNSAAAGILAAQQAIAEYYPELTS